METLPLFLPVSGKPVLVLGSGEAALAKARLVEEAGGIVVAELSPEVRLAFVALDDGNEETAAELKAAGILVNVVDRPELCDFLVPAIVDRSPVVVAIGTGGASASLSKALKERLEMLLPPTLGPLAAAIHQSRAAVGAVHSDIPARRAFWSQALAPGAPLDPLAPVANPSAAIVDALASKGEPTDSFTEILVGEDGAEGLTLRQLRLMAQADLVIYEPGLSADILVHARRDATRRVGTERPEGEAGRIILIRKSGDAAAQQLP